jgi:hypothetical protein
MRFLIALMMAFVLLGMGTVEAQIKPQTGGPVYQPPKQFPIVPVAIKRRWRVSARMRFRDGTTLPVVITWYGLPGEIDWSTAAVLQINLWNRYDYRYWSPWERWGATFEVVSAPVDDMNTPY